MGLKLNLLVKEQESNYLKLQNIDNDFRKGFKVEQTTEEAIKQSF